MLDGGQRKCDLPDPENNFSICRHFGEGEERGRGRGEEEEEEEERERGGGRLINIKILTRSTGCGYKMI